MDARIFRINYKSDFILTLKCDAGWATPFCIKFWTGAPSLAYYAQYDGETFTHCSLDPDDPTKLTVQFDDHHLPIGNLKFQIAYHFTSDDFPDGEESEVTNTESVIIEVDGVEQQVMLDFTGDMTAEIQFNLPAMQAEEQRQRNEAQRIANEEEREREFAQMQQENAQAVEGAENVNATLNGTVLTVTNRNGQSTSSDVRGQQGERGPQGEQGIQGETGATGPTGPQGETGPQGVPGTAATITVGTVTTGAAGSQAAVNNIGTSSAAVLDFTIPRGDKGIQGETGPQGVPGNAATIAVGTVTTGAAGSQAAVNNIGTSSAAVLDFTIPRGDQGIQGETGPQGPQGPKGDPGDVVSVNGKVGAVTLTAEDVGAEDLTAIVAPVNATDATLPITSLTTEVGKYYRIDVAVETLAVTLPAMTDLTTVRTVVIYLTGGTTPAVTIASADSKDVYYQDGFEIEAGKTYEVNCLWNGLAWIIASVEIVIPEVEVEEGGE